jgi:hypothetical protein
MASHGIPRQSCPQCPWGGSNVARGSIGGIVGEAAPTDGEGDGGIFMRIDAFIQSANYADMLALTLPQNKGFFDSVTVYTKRGDEATKAVCASNRIACEETDRFTQNGSRFNRGAVYNEAFQDQLLRKWGSGEARQWFCILDSDIILPSGFRDILEVMDEEGSLDPECFYGARRWNVETMEQYDQVRRRGDEAFKGLTLFRGYAYGYLQFFNVHSTTFRRLWNETHGNPYLEWHDGSWADCAFRLNWGDAPWNPPTQPPHHILDHSVAGPVDPPTGLLRQLPFNVIHLGITGMNDTHRKTPLWTTPSL